MRQQDKDYLEALERERLGYERRGERKRLAAVEAEIARLTGRSARQERPRGQGSQTRKGGE